MGLLLDHSCARYRICDLGKVIDVSVPLLPSYEMPVTISTL